MYCDADLSMAKVAASNVPDYLLSRKRRFPFKVLLVFLVAAGVGAAYYMGYLPRLPGGPAKNVSIATQSHIEAFDVDTDSAVVRARWEWGSGAGSLVIQKAGSTALADVLSRKDGVSPLEVQITLPRGLYQAIVSCPEPPGRLQIWIK